ncbi:hypothetical protein R3P38DRAFT_2605536 [Favolaschia claudopus]|uniref:Uncharacterized protein n=1 Tax=Favolaschia claudopus TaxID=2862362 RepID=A0AAW0DDJ9_9AGAR
MAAPSNSTPPNLLPEDVERAIVDATLYEWKEMCNTMALVASRFYSWTKPHIYRTVIVRRTEHWTRRISDVLIPNAALIQTLVVDLPLVQGSLSDDELSAIARLVEAAQGVKNLAVPWNIWIELPNQCGSLALKSLYLFWDRTHPATEPSLANLQHPEALEELVIYAPADLREMTPFRSWGDLYFPDTSDCSNLAYIAYAADRCPMPTVGSLREDIPHLKAAMFVLAGIPEKFIADEDPLVTEDRETYPNFFSTYLRYWSQLLKEWIARTEGAESILNYSQHRTVDT